MINVVCVAAVLLVNKSTTRVLDPGDTGTLRRRISHERPTDAMAYLVCAAARSQARIVRAGRRGEVRMERPSLVT